MALQSEGFMFARTVCKAALVFLGQGNLWGMWRVSMGVAIVHLAWGLCLGFTMLSLDPAPSHLHLHQQQDLHQHLLHSLTSASK